MTRTTLKILKPPRLRRGDCIGLVAPASTPSSSEKIEKGVRYLESLGYRVIVGTHVSEVYGYLAGTDEQRASDFNAMVADRNVKAIIAIRGGYGTPRILSLVDYRSLKRNPKIIVGYSDLTALQLAIFRKTGLVTFSGPMSGVEMWDGIDPYTEEQFWRIITTNRRVGPLRNPDEEPLAIMRAGTGAGRILGGNFALVVSLLGTPYAPNLDKAILVLEDVDEAPHRIDRMLAQLFHAGILKDLAGLVFGKFTDCVPTDPTKPYLTVDQILREVPAKVKCPVIANFQYGHIAKKLTVPLGLKGRIETKSGTVEVVENAVV